MSKKQQALNVILDHIDQNPNFDVADASTAISLIIENVGMTEAGARTYWSDIKKTLGVEQSRRAALSKRNDETDEQIATRLNERFDVIEMLSQASCDGRIRSLVISGPAGLGKSYTIEKNVRENDARFEVPRSVIVKGFIRPTGLYALLYRFRHPGNVLVMDDSDSIFNDQDALNLLKAACDTTERRTLSWKTAESRMVDEHGEPIPDEFEFEGTVIFITNIDFDAEIARGGRGAEHFEALISRSHYVECDMHTTREYIVRIKQVVKQGMLRDQKGMSKQEEKAIVDFIEANQDKLRELTLRMALKLADVYQMNPEKFESLAKVSCFKGGQHLAA